MKQVARVALALLVAGACPSGAKADWTQVAADIVDFADTYTDGLGWGFGWAGNLLPENHCDVMNDAMRPALENAIDASLGQQQDPDLAVWVIDVVDYIGPGGVLNHNHTVVVIVDHGVTVGAWDIDPWNHSWTPLPIGPGGGAVIPGVGEISAGGTTGNQVVVTNPGDGSAGIGSADKHRWDPDTGDIVIR